MRWRRSVAQLFVYDHQSEKTKKWESSSDRRFSCSTSFIIFSAGRVFYPTMLHDCIPFFPFAQQSYYFPSQNIKKHKILIYLWMSRSALLSRSRRQLFLPLLWLYLCGGLPSPLVCCSVRGPPGQQWICSVLWERSGARLAVNSDALELWLAETLSLTPSLMVQRAHQPRWSILVLLSLLFLHPSLTSVIHKSYWALCLKGTTVE